MTMVYTHVRNNPASRGVPSMLWSEYPLPSKMLATFPNSATA